MTDCCATKKLRLAEAELALHRLLTGSKQEEVTFGPSKSVKYNSANLKELRAYISDLRDQVAQCDGATRTKRAPVRFTF